MSSDLRLEVCQFARRLNQTERETFVPTIEEAFSNSTDMDAMHRVFVTQKSRVSDGPRARFAAGETSPLTESPPHSTRFNTLWTRTTIGVHRIPKEMTSCRVRETQVLP